MSYLRADCVNAGFCLDIIGILTKFFKKTCDDRVAVKEEST